MQNRKRSAVLHTVLVVHMSLVIVRAVHHKRIVRSQKLAGRRAQLEVHFTATLWAACRTGDHISAFNSRRTATSPFSAANRNCPHTRKKNSGCNSRILWLMIIGNCVAMPTGDTALCM